MAKSQQHTFLIYFESKRKTDKQPYLVPLQYYEDYFKVMHSFSGSRVRTSVNYVLKGFDEQKKDKDKIEYVKPKLSLSCPYCFKSLYLDTKIIISNSGRIGCICKKSFVINPKGKMIYAETWDIKSSVTSNNESEIKKWIDNQSRYYDIRIDTTDSNWEGLIVECSNKDVEGFFGELSQSDFSYQYYESENAK